MGMSKERWEGILDGVLIGIRTSIVAAVIGSLISGVQQVSASCKVNRAEQNAPPLAATESSASNRPIDTTCGPYAPAISLRGTYSFSRSNQVE